MAQLEKLTKVFAVVDMHCLILRCNGTNNFVVSDRARLILVDQFTIDQSQNKIQSQAENVFGITF